MGSTFPQKYPKLAMGPPSSNSLFCFFGKTKEGPTTRQLQGFLHVGRWRFWRAAWRRQGISKAHPQAPYRQGEAQHESSAQGFHFLENSLLISWKPRTSNGHPQGSFFLGRMASWFSGGPERLTGVLKADFFGKKVGPGMDHPEVTCLSPYDKSMRVVKWRDTCHKSWTSGSKLVKS